MFEFLAVVCFFMLLVKAVGLALKLTWGAARLIAGLLIGIAVPALLVCLIFVGGIALLIPLALLAAAVGIVKAFL